MGEPQPRRVSHTNFARAPSGPRNRQRRWLRARPVAEVLDIEEGSLVLVLDRVVTTRDGRPAEWRVAECNLTRQHLSAMSKGGGSAD